MFSSYVVSCLRLNQTQCHSVLCRVSLEWGRRRLYLFYRDVCTALDKKLTDGAALGDKRPGSGCAVRPLTTPIPSLVSVSSRFCEPPRAHIPYLTLPFLSYLPFPMKCPSLKIKPSKKRHYSFQRDCNLKVNTVQQGSIEYSRINLISTDKLLDDSS